MTALVGRGLAEGRLPDPDELEALGAKSLLLKSFQPPLTSAKALYEHMFVWRSPVS